MPGWMQTKETKAGIGMVEGVVVWVVYQKITTIVDN